MIKTLKKIAAFFIPHFVKDKVAVVKNPQGGYDLVCSMLDVQEGERFDGFVEVEVFAFLFWAWPISRGEQSLVVHDWCEVPK